MPRAKHKIYTVVAYTKSGEKIKCYRTTKLSKAEQYLYKTALRDSSISKAYIETQHRDSIRGIFRED